MQFATILQPLVEAEKMIMDAPTVVSVDMALFCSLAGRRCSCSPAVLAAEMKVSCCYVT